MAGRLRHNQESHWTRRWISHLVTLAGHDPDSTSGTHEHGLTLDFHHDLTFQDVKELLRVFVMMSNFSRTGWHEFFDHAQLRISYQIPSITIVSPAIVLGIFAVDRAWSSGSLRRDCFPGSPDSSCHQIPSPTISVMKDQCSPVRGNKFGREEWRRWWDGEGTGASRSVTMSALSRIRRRDWPL